MRQNEVVLYLISLLDNGQFFNANSVTNVCKCSVATFNRALKKVRTLRKVFYDWRLGVYREDEPIPFTMREKYKRTMSRHGEEMRLKSKLYYIYGKDWKKHYEEITK